MSALQAVENLLAQVGKPLHYRELTRLILERGLWHTTGKTPEATVNALLAVDIKERGSNSTFQRTGEGIFALRAWGLPEFEAKPESPQAAHKRTQPVRTLSFSDAAEQVLERFGNKRPMHYRAITERALKSGILRTEGQTPEATLYAQILTEIARKTRRGDTPRFVKHGKGFVGLSKWAARGLAFQIEQQNSAARKKLHVQLLAMPPAEFEELIGKLLVAIGFEDVTVTKRSGDDGIDVRGTLVVGDVIRIRMAVQAKKWKQNVQSPVIQQVRGSLGTHEQGLIITTSDFSPGARAEAERANAVPVALMNGEQLVALLVEHDIGVYHKTLELIELGEPEEEE